MADEPMTTFEKIARADELLPCPFCGGVAERRIEYDYIEAGEMGLGSSAGSVSRPYVACSTCGARTQEPNQYSQYHWNTRVASDGERMREAAAKIALSHSDGGGGEWDSAASSIYDDIMALHPMPSSAILDEKEK